MYRALPTGGMEGIPSPAENIANSSASLSAKFLFAPHQKSIQTNNKIKT